MPVSVLLNFLVPSFVSRGPVLFLFLFCLEYSDLFLISQNKKFPIRDLFRFNHVVHLLPEVLEFIYVAEKLFF